MTSYLNTSLPTILTSPATGAFKKPPFSLDLSTLSIVPGESDELSPLFAVLPHEQAPVEARAFSVVLCSGGILVRDPPRGRLSRPVGPQVVSTFSLTPLFSPVITTPSLSCPAEVGIFPTSQQTNSHSLSQSMYRKQTKMPKKRRSLQSIFAPSFLHSLSPSSTSPTRPRMRSHSSASQSISSYPSTPSITSDTSPSPLPARTSPPPDLLDDDPFADLSPAPSTSSLRSPSRMLSPSPPKSPEPCSSTPRSPLSPITTPEYSPKPIPAALSAPPTPALPLRGGRSRALSPGPSSVRPAHKKPAFASHPSLPSLDTLARTNITIPKKVRRGTVGARLPHEPWDMDTSGESSGSQDNHFSPQALDPSTPGFLPALEFDVMDFSTLEPELPPRASPSTVDDIFYSHSNQSGVNLEEPDNDDPRATLISPSSSALFSYSLLRATSSTSGSSSGSSAPEENFPRFKRFRRSALPPYGVVSHVQSSSAESESDLPISPVDGYFSFPSSRYSSDSSSDLHQSGYTSPAVVTTPHTSIYSPHDTLCAPDLMFEPETSVGTIRANLHVWASANRGSAVLMESWMKNGEAVDGSGWDERDHRGHTSRWDNGSSGTSSGENYPGDGSGGGYSNEGNWPESGDRGGDEGEDGGDDRYGTRSSFSTPTSSDVSSSDESEKSTDDSDDDVPLAQRIPTALSAQRTIRKQVREERDQRRKERAARGPGKSRSRQSTLRPAGAGDPKHQQTAMSSSREAALHASHSAKRERTQTLPGTAPRPFAVEDLSKKLMNAQLAELSTRHKLQDDHAPSTTGSSAEQGRSSGRARNHFQLGQNTQLPPLNPAQEGGRTLRPMRSFHRQEGKHFDDYRSMPLPADAGRVGRSVTSTGNAGSWPQQASRNGKPRSLTVQSLTDEPSMKSHRTSEERGKSTRPSGEPKSSRTSSEPGNHHSPRPSLQRTPTFLPPPDPVATNHQINAKAQTTQQRVFIADMQRFNVIEISPSTNAAEVLEMVEAQGSLKGWVGSGGWMLWEVAQDFGIQRPVRSFELVSDIQASWNKDKMVNTFVIKLTPLASLLSRSAIPTSSPKFSGYVEWESKRGKWNKRWMQLREHSLWLSKRDNGKDEVCLCALSNFDAYFVTRLHKAPKPFMFAIKSTDNLSFFENTADYLHVFSCSQKDGDKWMENILLARSYVLQQERHVLFNPKTSSGGAISSNSGPILRSGTRKSPNSHRPAQPLVNVAAPFGLVPTDPIFEPGSLLHKQT